MYTFVYCRVYTSIIAWISNSIILNYDERLALEYFEHYEIFAILYSLELGLNKLSNALLDILKKYESVNIVSIMQCAGNRAAEDIKATGKTGFVGTAFEFIEGGMVGNVQCM